jgi:hypothetical protein
MTKLRKWAQRVRDAAEKFERMEAVSLRGFVGTSVKARVVAKWRCRGIEWLFKTAPPPLRRHS